MLPPSAQGDYAGRKGSRLVAIIAVAVAVVVSAAASWATWKVVIDVTSPVGACERRLPIAEGLLVSEVHRDWPPPLIRCEVVDHDTGQESFRMTVTAITATHQPRCVTTGHACPWIGTPPTSSLHSSPAPPAEQPQREALS